MKKNNMVKFKKNSCVKIINKDDQYFNKKGFIAKILPFEDKILYSVYVYACEKLIVYNEEDLEETDFPYYKEEE